LAGNEGLKKNIEFYKGWREKVGDEFPLSLDCYMALTVPYATRLANELEPYGLKWMEEFLLPDDYESYAQVREHFRGSKVLLTTGEHKYNRNGF
jgi:L-rhamnonate dehydratase